MNYNQPELQKKGEKHDPDQQKEYVFHWHKTCHTNFSGDLRDETCQIERVKFTTTIY